ncbi:MAG: metallophosphoesterase [Oscillospiraceae bacterium]
MLKKYLSVILSLFLFAVPLTFSGCGKVKTLPEVKKETSIKLPKNGMIRVLQITDLHLTNGTKKQDKQTFKWLEEAIKFADADIVALTGDAVGGLAKNHGRDKALIKVAELFEKNKVYWMYTFGNHDGEWSYKTGTQVGLTDGIEGREELYELLKGYKYSLMQKGDTDGIGNYVVDVVGENNKTVYSFINMDTHGKTYDNSGKDIGYKGLTENQVTWYENAVKDTANRTADGKNAQTALFMHVPLAEYTDAWKNLSHIGGFNEINLEGKVYSQPQDKNTGCFEKIKELKSTTFISVGHDHDFNWLRNYDGVYFSYARVSGVNAWGRRAPVGATLIDINPNATTLEGTYKVSVIEPSFNYSPWEG